MPKTKPKTTKRAQVAVRLYTFAVGIGARPKRIGNDPVGVKHVTVGSSTYTDMKQDILRLA